MATFADSPERRGPMTRPALWLAFGLGLLVIFLTAWSFIYGQEAIVAGGGIISCFVLALSPFITGTATVIMTIHSIERSPVGQPVSSYVVNVLRRFRYLLVLVIALMPAIPMFGLYLILALPVIIRVVIGSVDTPDHFPVVYPQNVMLRTIGYLLVALDLWGVNLLIPTLAAVLTLKSRSVGFAIFVAWFGAGMVLAVSMFVQIGLLLGVNPPAGGWPVAVGVE